VYNIVCDSLGITPLPNNGTLRLPLRPVGLHSDADNLPDETPVDPVAFSSSSSTPASSPSAEAVVVPVAAESSATLAQPSTAASPASSAAPTGTASKDSWWQWLTHKAEGAEEWVDTFLADHFTGLQNGKEGKENQRPAQGHQHQH
jgi:hypothetical protein